MKHYLLSYSKKRQYLLFIVDVFVIVIAIFCSYAIRMLLNSQSFEWAFLMTKISPWLILVIISHIFGLYILDLYNLNRIISRSRSTIMVIFSVVFAGFIIGAIFFFLPKYIFGRQVLLIHLIVVSILLSGWRLIFNEWMVRSETKKRVAYVGSFQSLQNFVAEMENRIYTGIQIGEIYTLDNREKFSQYDNGNIIFYESVSDLLENAKFDILIFDVLMKDFSDYEIMEIMRLKHQGKSVFDLPSIVKNISGKVSLEFINGTWIVHQQSMQGQVGRAYLHFKRFFDIVGALFLLLLLLPISLVVMCLIKIDSSGPVLFKQQRLGRHKHPFYCLKFRSMVVDAEKESGPVWAKEKDSRVTRVGSFIRKSRLDEIPQLWNILSGDISFVGPRPIRQYFADMLVNEIPFYELRFAVQPGLSGWAQVNHNYANSVEGQKKKFEYELFYIQNMSFFLDIMVVFKTIQSVMSYSGK